MTDLVILRAYDSLWQSLVARVYEPNPVDGRLKIEYHDKFGQKSGFEIEFAGDWTECKSLIESRHGAVTYRTTAPEVNDE